LKRQRNEGDGMMDGRDERREAAAEREMDDEDVRS
jgi:hypothetical protein